ncbi:MAG: hypothetical protein IJJ23_04565 [Clostridia bacterium]|nr:hypothetical protein [Clostridia bacterium]
MRRCIAVFLVFMMMTLPGTGALALLSGKSAPTAAPVSGGEPSASLDAAFESGRLTLVRAELPAVTAEAFDLPDVLWSTYGMEKPADPKAELAAALEETSLTWISLSPNGTSGILTDGGLGIAYYDGAFRLLYPSSARGVEDTYGNLAKYAQAFTHMLGNERVVYSPDGRYAVVLSTRMSLINAQFFIDPIVIDLSTGEMILTSTYGNKPMDDSMGCATSATFSADGRYMYYMLYGNAFKSDAAPYRTCLCRYDLQTGETMFCHSWDDCTYYPGLSETPSGALIILRDTYQNSLQTGVSRVAFENGAWTNAEYTFDLPSMYWNSNKMLYSAESGNAVIPGRVLSYGGVYYAFQCVKPDEDFASLNRYLTISKESGIVEAHTGEEIKSMLDSAVVEETFVPDALPCQMITYMDMSSDGRYLLALTQTMGTRHIYMIRLSDLAVREVAGVDPAAILMGDLATAKGYMQVLEWDGDTLFLCMEDVVQAFTFAE